MKKVLVTIADDLRRRADRAARQAGLTRSALLSQALERYLTGGNGRRLLDDPRLRGVLERMRRGDYGWKGRVDVVAEIRRMRESRYGR
ncbi:MAG: hypothetical protein ACREIU_07675 [Planctomycetota bacterium]